MCLQLRDRVCVCLLDSDYVSARVNKDSIQHKWMKISRERRSVEFWRLHLLHGVVATLLGCLGCCHMVARVLWMVARWCHPVWNEKGPASLGLCDLVCRSAWVLPSMCVSGILSPVLSENDASDLLVKLVSAQTLLSNTWFEELFKWCRMNCNT